MNDHTFLSLVNKRQSVRKYTDKPVEPEKLQRCLEAARLAPSASNSQPWKFVVVTDPALQQQVAKETIGLLITLGYAPEDYRVRQKIRKNPDEVINYNSYKK
jgi:nitroreductase